MRRPRWFKQAVREAIADVFVYSARMDAEAASGWLVVSCDEESGHLHISGPYLSPEAALIAAQIDHEEVNRGLGEGEAGWKHTVWPLYPPRTGK